MSGVSPRAAAASAADGLAVTAFAPGSIGNFGPGLDILGCALDGPGDEVTAMWSESPGIVILDSGHPELPADAARHTSALAAAEVLRLADVRPAQRGVALTVRKGLPLSGGQGGSAASAVAATVAVNALLGSPLGDAELLAASLVAEEAVAGRHLDNLAPALLGGIVLVRSMSPPDVVSLPVPNELRIVLARPAQRLRTAEARAVLPTTVERGVAMHQAAQVAAVVAALASGDLALLGRAIDDRIAEPVRAGLLPGFRAAKRAALGAGALGASISGAGPTMFALVGDEPTGRNVGEAMRAAYLDAGVPCDVRLATVDRAGARVLDDTSDRAKTGVAR